MSRMNSSWTAARSDGATGKIAAEARAHFVGDRLPDGALADVLEIIENVVQHAVRLARKAAQSAGSRVGIGVMPGGFGSHLLNSSRGGEGVTWRA